MSSSKTLELEVDAFFGLMTLTSSPLLPEEGLFKGFDLVLGEEESVVWPLDVLILESPVSVESDPLVFLGDDDIDALGFLEDGDRELELVLAFEPLALFGDLELDFLGGRGECPGLIELNNSLYCFLANRLPICIVIKTFRSLKPSAFTTLAPPPDCRFELAFLAEDLALALVADLTVVGWEDFDDDDCGTAEPGVLSPLFPLLQLEAHELPKKSLPDFGSQSFGTLGGADGRGVILLGEEDVKTSVG